MTTRKTYNTVEVEYDWVEVDGSLDAAIKMALQEQDVVELANGSDYVQQYYEVQVSANSLVFIFRSEPEN